MNPPIILAEDNKELRETIKEILIDLNLTVYDFSNGKEAFAAIQKLRNKNYILFTDFEMPGANADFLFEMIIESDLLPAKIIVMSGVMDLPLKIEKYKVKFQEMKINFIQLNKPFRIQKIESLFTSEKNDPRVSRVITQRPGYILSSARQTSGFSIETLISKLKENGLEISFEKYMAIEKGEVPTNQIPASTWFIICYSLSLSPESLMLGYNQEIYSDSIRREDTKQLDTPKKSGICKKVKKLLKK